MKRNENQGGHLLSSDVKLLRDVRGKAKKEEIHREKGIEIIQTKAWGPPYRIRCRDASENFVKKI